MCDSNISEGNLLASSSASWDIWPIRAIAQPNSFPGFSAHVQTANEKRADGESITVGTE